MKRNVTLALTGRAVIGCLILFGLLLAARESAAASGGFNPYSAIVERNSFGLKPAPNPADLVKPPPPPVSADIKLQGIATILGRNQVLMKVKLPARPPEPAREQALVLSEGQRDGEVEVLEINPAEGSVKVKNGSEVLALNMRDHGEKPTPGAAVRGSNGCAPASKPAGCPTSSPSRGSAVGQSGRIVGRIGQHLWWWWWCLAECFCLWEYDDYSRHCRPKDASVPHLALYSVPGKFQPPGRW